MNQKSSQFVVLESADVMPYYWEVSIRQFIDIKEMSYCRLSRLLHAKIGFQLGAERKFLVQILYARMLVLNSLF